MGYYINTEGGKESFLNEFGAVMLNPEFLPKSSGNTTVC